MEERFPKDYYSTILTRFEEQNQLVDTMKEYPVLPQFEFLEISQEKTLKPSYRTYDDQLRIIKGAKERDIDTKEKGGIRDMVVEAILAERARFQTEPQLQPTIRFKYTPGANRTELPTLLEGLSRGVFIGPSIGAWEEHDDQYHRRAIETSGPVMGDLTRSIAQTALSTPNEARHVDAGKVIDLLLTDGNMAQGVQDAERLFGRSLLLQSFVASLLAITALRNQTEAPAPQERPLHSY